MFVAVFSALLFSCACAQYTSQSACQSASYGGCMYNGPESGTWLDTTPWICAAKQCPFHLKPLPGDCVAGLAAWPTKGNASVAPMNAVMLRTLVTEALRKDMKAVAMTPPSPQWSGFQLAGKPNQYWMTTNSGTLVTTDEQGALVGYKLRGSDSGYAVSEKWVVAAYDNGDTSAYNVLPNTPTGPNVTVLVALLPKPPIAHFWPFAADGDYIWVATQNSTTTPLDIYRWNPSVPGSGFQHFGRMTGEKACISPPAGDWALVVEGSMLGALFYTSAGGGYPCVMDLSKPDSAKALVQFDTNAKETPTFQMDEKGNVVYKTPDSIWYATYADKQFRDLEYEIKFATTYEFFPGSTVHYPAGDYFWKNTTLVYQGNGGYWAYQFLHAGAPPYPVLPVVLDFSNPSYAPCGQTGQVQYGGLQYLWRNPMVADNGTIFFLTLESTDGAVGATGHIWGLDSPLFVPAKQCASCPDQGNGGHGTCASATCWCNTGCSGSDCSTCTGPQVKRRVQQRAEKHHSIKINA